MSGNNDYTTGNLSDFAYFKGNHRLIAIDLSKQTNLKDPQQINFISSMEQQYFSSLRNLKKLLFNFYKILWTSYKNGNAKHSKSFYQFWKWVLKICVRSKMVRYWQWNKGKLFTQKSNQIFNRFIRTKSLWLF